MSKRMIIGNVKNPPRSTFMFCRVLKEQDDGDPKGSCAILLPKSDKKSHKAVMEAIQIAGEKKFGSNFSAKSKKMSIPVRCGDEELEDDETSFGEEAQDHWIIGTSCWKVPGLADRRGKRIQDPDELDDLMVSGNYFLFSVTFKGFSVDGNKGVRAELNNVMFVKEGERLDGSKNAEQDFADYAIDDDDDLDDDIDDEEEEKPRKKRKKDRKGRRRRR